MRRQLSFFILWGVICTMPAFASGPGDLDPTFGSGGVVTTPGGSNHGGAAYALVLQPDGKLVAAGQYWNGADWDFGLVRYNPDGSLDTTFGNAGIVSTGIAPSGLNTAFEYGRALVLQPDNRLVLAGFVSSDDEFRAALPALARYNPDGSFDATFGSGGTVITSIAGEANALALLPDGGLITAGYAPVGNGHTGVALISYNPDGSLDTTFGNGGIATIPLSGGYDQGRALVVQPDGTLVVACLWRNNSLISRFALIRTTADGSLDATFGVGGIAKIQFPNSLDYDNPHAVVRQSDGKLVVAGVSYTPRALFALARFNTDGSLDPAFGGTGMVTTPIGTYARAFALTLQPDGKLVAAGAYASGSQERFALVRYNPDGTLDTSFGSGGVVAPTSAGGIPLGAARALVLQPDGRFAAAGDSFTLARYVSGTCGNGIVDAGEECDDGNTTSGDGCDVTCAVTRCGNAVTTNGEECDDGNNNTNDACENDCRRNVCGDGVLLSGVEQCDDGNLNPNDACKNDCTLNICGDGVLRIGVEQCDDGNRNTNDACTNNCTVNVCGDGVVYTGVEQCDDGNRIDADGCESDCTLSQVFDTVVLPLKPQNVRLRIKHPRRSMRVRVKVRDATAAASGQGTEHTVQLLAEPGDCPVASVGTPDFGDSAAGAPDTVQLGGGGSASALVPLTISSDAFLSFNRKAPKRCTLTFRARTVTPTGTYDPTPANNVATMEVNVTDRRDPEQTAFHEVVINSRPAVSVRIAKGQARARVSLAARIGNADLGEAGGHTSAIQTSDGDCPAGTVGPADFQPFQEGMQSFTTVRGGKTARANLQLTLDRGAIKMASATSPARCTAVLTVTGPGGDTEASNNATRLVIDVVDANDF